MYYDMKYRIVSVDCEALRLQLCGQVTSSSLLYCTKLGSSRLTRDVGLGVMLAQQPIWTTSRPASDASDMSRMQRLQ
jgi:hypothetical protein